MGIIQRRPDEVTHACIDYAELLHMTFLHVEHLCYEASHLSHYGTPQLEMQMLTVSQFQVFGIGLKVCLEVW